MIEDYKKLLPFLRESTVLNSVLDVFNNAFEDLNSRFQEAFDMLNIDKCSGEYLDNLGQLIGVYRPVVDMSVQYLKSEDMIASIDTGLYSVGESKDEEVNKRMALDSDYRMLIKAQIIRNNLKTYSVNDLEMIARLLFFNENFKTFYINVEDYNEWKIKVHIDKTFSHSSKVFLRRLHTDKHGRKKFYFPYPPIVTSVDVVDDNAIIGF